jgi:hypothetical protein
MTGSAQEAAHHLRTLLGRAGQHLRPGRSRHEDRQRRWLVVTVEGTSEAVAPAGVLPAPLADLGDAIEVDLRPAPGQRGTEVAARLVADASVVAEEDEQSAAEDPRRALRRALRQVKQLVEVGEVLVADPRSAGYRPRTIAGLLVDKAERESDEGGVL